MSAKVEKLQRLGLDPDWLSGFCLANGIARLSLFGSRSREDFAPDSDVDLLIEFLPGHAVGFFKLVEIEQELSAILGGKKVDLVTLPALSHIIRDSALSDAVELYAA